jgi:serine/threonine protein kinase
LGPLGRGSNSFVYKVRHRKEGYLAALKVIDRKKIDSESSMQRLKTEIAIHRALKNEHLVTLYKVFKDTSNFYLLIEYCEQGELYDLLQKEKR